MNKTTWGISSLLLTVTLMTIGCGPTRPETAKVEGTVTYQGKLLEGARISFFPVSGRPANGMTDSQGKFTLMTFDVGDGAMPGTHKVTIAKQKEIAAPSPQNPHGKVQHFIPKLYSNVSTSGLTKSVKPGKNTFDFDLKE